MLSHATLRQELDGTWSARTDLLPEPVTAPTRDACVAALREAVAGPGRNDLVIELAPRLAGVAEAAEILGWDKRRVVTYIDRGAFPEPLQTLRSGRLWLRSDLEAFAEAWHARNRERTVRLARAGEGTTT